MQATGDLHLAYSDLARHAPRIGYVVQIFSLRAKLVRLVGLFFTEVLGAGTLSRQDKEILCVVTSRTGKCKY